MDVLRCNFELLRLPASPVFSDFRRLKSCSYSNIKVFGSRAQRFRLRMPHGGLYVRAMDDDSFGAFALDDWGDTSRPVEYIVSSSEGEDSEGEIFLHTVSDIDLPTSKERLLLSDDSVTVTAHRLVTLGGTSNRRSAGSGVMNSVGLALISTVFLLVMDQCAWRIARMPLAPFYLMRPFLIALTLVPFFGYICLPLFRMLKIGSVLRKGSPQYPFRMATVLMDGIFFVPIGILVAEAAVKFSSTEVSGAATATILLTSIGLLADYFGMNKNNMGLPAWMRGWIEVAVGSWFSIWMYTTDIATPYSVRMVVPLPPPIGLVCARNFYPILTSMCFVSTVSGVDLTDGVHGLAPGTAALAFIGMSMVVIPICSELSIFGASMAGACIGYLLHCHYNNAFSVSMGHTGALALGGALAAMASCTGMFFPLLISAGVFIIEWLSVITQVSWFKATKFVLGKAHKLLRMAPLHHHLVLSGVHQQKLVTAAYFLTSVLVVCASYVGLSSL